jgi:hypothetical protein
MTTPTPSTQFYTPIACTIQLEGKVVVQSGVATGYQLESATPSSAYATDDVSKLCQSLQGRLIDFSCYTGFPRAATKQPPFVRPPTVTVFLCGSYSERRKRPTTESVYTRRTEEKQSDHLPKKEFPPRYLIRSEQDKNDCWVSIRCPDGWRNVKDGETVEVFASGFVPSKLQDLDEE